MFSFSRALQFAQVAKLCGVERMIRMEDSMSRVLIETVIREALEHIKENPERGIRNLIDKGLQFSDSRSQRYFFTTIQGMLQNENSAYYALVREIVAYADTGRFATLGINIGYNGFTVGVNRIRKNEQRLGCSIPWSILIQADPGRFEENRSGYDALIREGESLGIFNWMLFITGHPEAVLSLAEAHGESAFFLFCDAQDLTGEFLEEASQLYNIMPVVRCSEDAADACAMLRQMGFLYSVWHPYGPEDLKNVLSGDLFCSAEQISPVFTALLPRMDCPDEVQSLGYEAVQYARNSQMWKTLPWEMRGDLHAVSSYIIGAPCTVCFDSEGDLCVWDQKTGNRHQNLFRSSLTNILTDSFPRKAAAAG